MWRYQSNFQTFISLWYKETTLVIHNKNNEKSSAKSIINKLISNNQSIALVSDAGMPLVNDPGFEIVKLANANNIDIEIIPGVSASYYSICT